MLTNLRETYRDTCARVSTLKCKDPSDSSGRSRNSRVCVCEHWTCGIRLGISSQLCFNHGLCHCSWGQFSLSGGSCFEKLWKLHFQRRDQLVILIPRILKSPVIVAIRLIWDKICLILLRIYLFHIMWEIIWILARIWSQLPTCIIKTTFFPAVFLFVWGLVCFVFRHR